MSGRIIWSNMLPQKIEWITGDRTDMVAASYLLTFDIFIQQLLVNLLALVTVYFLEAVGIVAIS
jgi:hypothetical protein